MATLNDIKVLLKNRVGYKKPIDKSFENLSDDNFQSDSGLYFQNAHPMVSFRNIRNTQPIVDITDETFNLYLSDLRESNVLEVLNDVFQGVSSIDEELILEHISAFDKAIYLRMVLKVGEIILSSDRINTIAFITGEMIAQWRLDLNGSNDGDYINPNYPFHSGYTTRYKVQYEHLRTQFNNIESQMLEKVTVG